MALLKLAERYSSQRLESACQKTLSYTASPSLKSIQSILKSGQDKRSPRMPRSSWKNQRLISLPEVLAIIR